MNSHTYKDNGDNNSDGDDDDDIVGMQQYNGLKIKIVL